MIFKKKEKEEVYEKYDWEIALETEIMETQSRHNFGEMSEEEYEKWKEDILGRIQDIRRCVIGEAFNEQMENPMSALEKILP